MNDPFSEYLELWTVSAERSQSAGGRTSERDINVPVPAAPFLAGVDREMSSYLGTVLGAPQQAFVAPPAFTAKAPRSYRASTSSARSAAAVLPSAAKAAIPFSPMFAPSTGTLPTSKPTESSAPLSPPPGAPSSSVPDAAYVPPTPPDAGVVPASMSQGGSGIVTNLPPTAPDAATETTPFPWWVLLLLAGGWYVARQRQANTVG